jgi:hypothetical protein
VRGASCVPIDADGRVGKEVMSKVLAVIGGNFKKITFIFVCDLTYVFPAGTAPKLVGKMDMQNDVRISYAWSTQELI